MPKIFSKGLERTCHDMCKVYPSCIVPMQRNSKSSLRKLLSCMFAHKCLQCFKCLMCFQPQLMFMVVAFHSIFKHGRAATMIDLLGGCAPFNIFLSMEVLWLWLTYLVVTFHSHFKSNHFCFMILEASSSHLSPKQDLSLGSCCQHLLIMSARLELRPLGRFVLSLAFNCP
jgi:hypothetical protein